MSVMAMERSRHPNAETWLFLLRLDFFFLRDVLVLAVDDEVLTADVEVACATWGGGVALRVRAGGVLLRDEVSRSCTVTRGSGCRACCRHCGQTITPSLASNCSLLMSSFLPHLGHVQRMM